MFDAYARGGRSLQVQTKGYYWAGRAALAAGQLAASQRLFPARRGLSRSCSTASSRSSGSAGRSPPPSALGRTYAATPAQRTAFNNRRLVQAVRLIEPAGQRDRAGASSSRALAESLDNDADRTSRSSLASRSAARTSRCGSRASARNQWLDVLCPPGLSDPVRPRSRPACGRWPTESPARKARSIRMRSATPARAA